jgi:hypothetical protein
MYHSETPPCCSALKSSRLGASIFTPNDELEAWYFRFGYSVKRFVAEMATPR